MDNKQKKDPSWLVKKGANLPSPATYDSAHYANKESFNMGKVPFGSFSA